MSDLDKLLEQMERDFHPPELEALVNEWITELYNGAVGQRSFAERYRWLRSLFRVPGVSNADIDDMMNETLRRYLGPVKSALWAAAAGHYIPDEDTIMPAVRWAAQQLGRPVREVARECIQENKHNELLDRFYGDDKLTQEDLEEDWRRMEILAEIGFTVPTRPSKPAPGAPLDPERLVYESPGATLRHFAKSVLIDQVRKSKAEAGRVEAEVALANEAASPDTRPDEQLYAQEKHASYLAGVRALPDLQRAAWVLCRDPLLLTDQEAEDLLQPALAESQAKCAAKGRPLSGEEAAALIGRDVSPDVAKAARKLRQLLYP